MVENVFSLIAEQILVFPSSYLQISSNCATMFYVIEYSHSDNYMDPFYR